ncbi:hypothetical protein [Nitratireductor basaltis]|uniref:hypothetical protein n=1 Tax=Nitratireductor basaltis TaxID=472175 RepID=UPI000A6AA964
MLVFPRDRRVGRIRHVAGKLENKRRDAAKSAADGAMIGPTHGKSRYTSCAARHSRL